MSERLTIEVARLAGRLAAFLGTAFPQPDAPLAQNLAFLRAASGTVPTTLPAMDDSEPLARLKARLGLGESEVDLLLLAGMPEDHEGYAAVFRTLHPRGEPRPTLGLAAQLFARGRRDEFRRAFDAAALVRAGGIEATGEVPFFERTLGLAEALWPALHGSETWPAAVRRVTTLPALHGLDDWLEAPAAARASRALTREEPCTVLVTADTEEAAFGRAWALVRAAGRIPAGVSFNGPPEPAKLAAVKLQGLTRGIVLLLELPPPEGPGAPVIPAFEGYPDVVVVCGRTGAITLGGTRPLLGLLAERLTPGARRAMWAGALPALSGSAALLAARYPVEPLVAANVAADLASLERIEERELTLGDVAEAIRARSATMLGGGVKLIRPTASWSHLVVPSDREAQLRAAMDRLDLQARVLDEWGFLRGRRGARGVRMLFTGPPGTGKTLAAEVLAGALEVDLLFVDISRVVSKWIGETEKNLATVFDTAERAQAVLFFDEADALFGRRTEVSDAHDRYANLETAYLLARLEQFEGLAILATNLRQNIDPAFLRRLEFLVEFDEPDREDRFRLWQCHIPSADLLDPDVNLYELAALYPVVGAFIRNAAVAAAFLAARDGGKITRTHLVRAIRREYEKIGKAFPGLPPGVLV
jgi:hypothetical protein